MPVPKATFTASTTKTAPAAKAKPSTKTAPAAKAKPPTKTAPAAKAKPATKTAPDPKPPVATKPVAKVPAATKPVAKVPPSTKPLAKVPTATKTVAATKKPPAAPRSSVKANYGSCCTGSPSKKSEATAKKPAPLKKKTTSYQTGMCYFSDTDSGSDSSFDGCPLLPSQMRMLIGNKMTATKKSVSVGGTYYYSDTYSDDYDCDGGSCSMSKKK